MKSIENSVGSHDHLSPISESAGLIDRQAQSLTRVPKYFNTDGLYGKALVTRIDAPPQLKVSQFSGFTPRYQRRFRQTEMA